MTLRFGTDGVRGQANTQLTPEFVLALGRAAARELDGTSCAVGRDTRWSGPLLTAALAAGLAAEGVDVIDLGVVPTPAVAHWASRYGQPGAVISASHNPFSDNGVKFFAAGGHKLTDATQAGIEEMLDRLVADPVTSAGADETRSGRDVGTIRVDHDGRNDYVSHLIGEATGGRDLAGIHVVLDAANGAASPIAAPVLTGLGATVTLLHADPDGCNINEQCGSTDPSDLQRTVVARKADVGLALDGDADRLVAVDETGAIIDGDALLAVFALDLAVQGRLRGDAIVATVMSNLGLRKALEPEGVEVITCPVGDRHVLAALAERGLVLGGEQSGHLVFTEHATTGDGLLAGVLLCDLVKRSGRRLGDLASVVTPLPQVLANVRLHAPVPDLIDRIAPQVEAAERRLGDDGRVLIRLSGTEPLVRVMVEATEQAVADDLVAQLTQAVATAAGH